MYLKRNLIFNKEKEAVPTTTTLTFDNILISSFNYLAFSPNNFPQILQKPWSAKYIHTVSVNTET